MPCNDSVFRGLVKLVPMHVFDRLVEEYETDKHVRRMSTRHQLVALLYGELSGHSSLREIEAGLSSHRSGLYHLGGRCVSRSTLADANAKRDWRVFAGLFAALVGQATRGLRRELKDVVRLIDSTSLRLAGIGSGWTGPQTACAKMHLVFDPDAACPVYHGVTGGQTNDVTFAQSLPLEPGATYVFDLGYYDYGWWARMHELGCRIVTRFKKNTPLHRPMPQALPKDAAALSDTIGFLPGRQAKSRRNPLADAVREIRVKTETGKILRLLTNDLDAPADEIAALYKSRWQIELFFRWIKQTLKIKAFLGRSENAVRIHIAVALIAFLLLHIAKTTNKVAIGLQAYARLIRTNIMMRKSWDEIAKTKPDQQPESRQIELVFQ